MSILSLLNQTITPKSKTSYDVDGKPVLSAGTDIKARIELKQRRRMLPNGSIIVTDGSGFLPPTATLTEDDHFIYDSVEYRLFKVEKVVGGNGSLHHYEIEFIKTTA